MMTDKIYTKNAPDAIGPYSQAVRCGGLLYTSGQIAIDLGSAKCMNVVLFGAMTRALEMDEIDWESVIRDTVPAKLLDLNLRAYRAGRDAV